MKRNLACGLLLLCSAIELGAQGVQPGGALGICYRDSYSSSQTQPFSFIVNAASLAEEKVFKAGVYAERQYMLEDLALYAAVLSFVAGDSHFGFSLERFGGPYFHQTDLGLAYALKMDKVDIGTGFHYKSAAIPAYRNYSLIYIQAGFLVHLNKELQAGVHIDNPAGKLFQNKEKESEPVVIGSGLGWDVSADLFMAVGVEKTESQPVNIYAGIRYRLGKKLETRVGINTATTLWYMGFGLDLGGLHLEVLASLHPYLGATPGLLMAYQSKQP